MLSQQQTLLPFRLFNFIFFNKKKKKCAVVAWLLRLPNVPSEKLPLGKSLLSAALRHPLMCPHVFVFSIKASAKNIHLFVLITVFCAFFSPSCTSVLGQVYCRSKVRDWAGVKGLRDLAISLRMGQSKWLRRQLGTSFLAQGLVDSWHTVGTLFSLSFFVTESNPKGENWA